MTKESEIITFAYINHKEYDDEKAGNQKHSTDCKQCAKTQVISDHKGTTSASAGSNGNGLIKPSKQ